MTFFKDSSRNRSSDSPPIEQYLPSDTLVTLEVADQDIPVLFSKIIENGRVQNHPAITQHRDIPKMAFDSTLEIVLPSDGNIPFDPDAVMTHHHPMSPLAERAAIMEQSMNNGPPKVYFKGFLYKLYKEM